MPPRSVCLNIFTTSLSNAIPKESSVSVKEVGNDVDMKEKDEMVTERARHDSVQSNPDETIAAAPYSISVTPASKTLPMPFTSTQSTLIPDGLGCGIATLREHHAARSATLNVQALVCETCNQSPAFGASLQRCSRCKSAYYCSKSCQKAGWKTHRSECGSASAIATPNISVPGSPTNMQESSPMAETSPFVRRHPQSTSDWQSSSGEGKLRLSFGSDAQYETLRDTLVCGYCLHTTANGGVAPTRDDALEEFKNYLDAVSERVDTGGVLDGTACKDQIHVDIVSSLQSGTSPLLKEVTAAEILEHYGSAILNDIEQIQKVVYGA